MVTLLKTKRSSRRKRYIEKLKKQQLDQIVSAKIAKNILWSMATHNGTRCSGCGQSCRPHHLTNLSMSGPGFHITAFGPACDYIKCPGERDWS